VALPIGLQLFTVQKEIAADRDGTFRELARIGYDGVELAPTDWPDVAELKSLLTETGLKLMSRHVPFARIRDKFDEVRDYCQELGIKNVVVPSIPGPAYQNEDELRKIVEQIAVIARNCRESGLRCSYHNHATEFQNTIQGQEVFDFIFEQVGTELLNAQIDTFFVEQVEKNPAQYVRRFSGHIPLLHCKDKANAPGAVQTEVGRGTIDWPAVFQAAKDAGVEWLIVEQNCGDEPALPSVRMSYDFVKSLNA